jgi:hypothetical protein
MHRKPDIGSPFSQRNDQGRHHHGFDVVGAGDHAPQLAAYAGAVQSITGRRCSELWIHMPIVGALFRLGQN